MNKVYVRTKSKGLVPAELRWKSEKGPWSFIRLNGRLRAVPNQCILKASTLGEFI